jgi:pimeloyl-ACP methyl ester carboxylesterase
MNALKSNKNIYLISGLGADETIFQRLNFGALNPIFIKWITPNENELIEQYALRLTEQIQEPNPIILGVSFGGMLAIEIAKQIDCQQVIIISSAKTVSEIPFYFRLIGQLNIHKLVPIKLLKYPNPLAYWFFGMHKKKEKELLKNILLNTDELFLKWAINAIVNWKNKESISQLIHIHGDLDRILPNKNKIDFIIPNGGHLMVFNQADLINPIISNKFKTHLS